MPQQPIKGLPIGALFALARQEARKAKMDQYRYESMRAASERQADWETVKREEGLDRMRAITNAQMVSGMTGSAIPVGIMVPHERAGESRPSVSPFMPQLVASPRLITG